MIFATCLTIAAALATMAGGDTVVLSGSCDKVTIARVYSPPITIEAEGATVRGLLVKATGGGVDWFGGTIKSPLGQDAAPGPNGYGVQISGGSDIRLFGVAFTDARKAMAISGKRISVRFSRFEGVREDGVIASSLAGLTITHNIFASFKPRPTTCTVGTVVTTGLAQRDCKGVWKDGDHSDAVQLRDAVTDSLIGWNKVDGYQGLGIMDTTGDRPEERITVIGNSVGVSGYHSITFGPACLDCFITKNHIFTTNPAHKTAYRFGPAVKICGNTATPPGGPGTQPCL